MRHMFYNRMDCTPILTLTPMDKPSWEEASRRVTSVEHGTAAPAMELERPDFLAQMSNLALFNIPPKGTPYPANNPHLPQQSGLPPCCIDV